MPANTAEQPNAEAVDIRFRNGIIKRGVDPKKYRWTIDDRRFGVGYAFDIAAYQNCEK